MTAAEREQLRLTLLWSLEAGAKLRFGIPTGRLAMQARAEGFSAVTSDEVTAELQYLVDKGLVVQVQKEVSPEMTAWRITAAGRDHLAMTQSHDK